MTSDNPLVGVTPVTVKTENFNENCQLPYGLSSYHIKQSMVDFIDFLTFLNQQLLTKDIPRLEVFLMPANFSSIVGEFMNMRIPKFFTGLVKNNYHNGHPDLIPRGEFPNDAVQHAIKGIEIKGSRHSGGWQGHNPESVWLMVFHFDCNSANDNNKGIPPKPFCFKGVYAAKLEIDDWSFSGRSGESRRTITASVLKSGSDKMKNNWVYKDPLE